MDAAPVPVDVRARECCGFSPSESAPERDEQEGKPARLEGPAGQEQPPRSLLTKPLEISLARSLTGLPAEKELEVDRRVRALVAFRIQLPLIEPRQWASDLLEAGLERPAARNLTSASPICWRVTSFQAMPPIDGYAHTARRFL